MFNNVNLFETTFQKHHLVDLNEGELFVLVDIADRNQVSYNDVLQVIGYDDRNDPNTQIVCHYIFCSRENMQDHYDVLEKLDGCQQVYKIEAEASFKIV